MTLQDAYFVTQIVVGIAIIASISFVALELKQNSFLLRKSMADQRTQKSNLLFETHCTDSDFRSVHRRVETDYANFTEDEKYLARSAGIRSLKSMLDELVAYYDGHISGDEWLNLEWNMQLAAKRPNVQEVYDFLKDGYPKKVQDYWESLSTEGHGFIAPDTSY